LRSALLGPTPSSARPSPFDDWASAEMLALVSEARVFRPELVAHRPQRAIIVRETAQILADHDPPALAARISQRVIFADAARTGQLAFEQRSYGAAAREIAALVTETERLTP
jgi:chromosome partitioning protein